MFHFFDFLFPLMLFGPMLVTCVICVHALSFGSYQRKAAQSEMAFLTPIACIVFGVTVLFNLAAMAALINDPDLEDALFVHVHLGSYVSTHPEAVKAALTVGAAVALLYWGVIRWYVKAFALVLNLERRTYSTVDFSRVLLKKRTGSWNDIAGVSVQRHYAKGNTIYYVRLKWNEPLKLASSLGGFSKSDKAEAFAARMSKELDLPLVAAPASWG